MAATSAAGRAAPDGPRPNPSDVGLKLRSPAGKGKPVALADITNTGRRDATRSLSIADVVKENAKLVQLLNEKIRTIEMSRVELQKLHMALQASRQQNLQLAQANSQMLAELNLGKDRLKALQHELSCTTALLKVKDSEIEKKNEAANQGQKEVHSKDVMKAISSKVAAGVARRIDGSVISATERHLVESRSVVQSTTGCQDPPNDIRAKKGRNKRKSESSDCIKDTTITQDHYRPHLQPVISLDHENPRKSLRRSTRLNIGSCEVTEVSCSRLPEDDVFPSAPSSFLFQKQHGPNNGKDTKSLQNERSHESVMASGFKKIEINEQPHKEANWKETEEASSTFPGIEAHQIGDTASNTKWSHSEEIQCKSSLPFNIVEPSKALESGIERGASKQKLKNGEDSAIEHVDAKCDTREPLRQDEKRKSQRRKSARLDSVLSENTISTSETLHDDVISPLPHSSPNASMEQTINHKQTDDCCPSTKAIEGQVAGRRSLRRAAEKVVSYKEIPLNVKMRRP